MQLGNTLGKAWSVGAVRHADGHSAVDQGLLHLPHRRAFVAEGDGMHDEVLRNRCIRAEQGVDKRPVIAASLYPRRGAKRLGGADGIFVERFVGNGIHVAKSAQTALHAQDLTALIARPDVLKVR